MRLKADGTISVNYPWHATQQMVLNFINKNRAWLEVQKEKQKGNKVVYLAGQSIQTKWHQVEIATATQNKAQAHINSNKVLIVVPQNRKPEDARNQNFIRNILAETYRREAKEYLPGRVELLAKSHGLSYKQVFVKKLKSKWGSCSSHKNINLNLYLMMLPDHLIDYIILHELAHTMEMNHGDKFWKLLNQLTQNQAKQWDKEIRKNYRID
jgi:predicted metal-dependent hydrolase